MRGRITTHQKMEQAVVESGFLLFSKMTSPDFLWKNGHRRNYGFPMMRAKRGHGNGGSSIGILPFTKGIQRTNFALFKEPAPEGG